jgi:hypothetical protein
MYSLCFKLGDEPFINLAPLYVYLNVFYRARFFSLSFFSFCPPSLAGSSSLSPFPVPHFVDMDVGFSSRVGARGGGMLPPMLIFFESTPEIYVD